MTIEWEVAVEGALGETLRCGQPWHGKMQDGTLTLPNAATLPLHSSIVLEGHTWLVDFGMPGVETSETETALGMLWCSDAVLFSRYAYYSPNTTHAIGQNRFVWLAPSGQRWLVSATALRESAVWDLKLGGVTVRIQIYVRPFGEFLRNPDAPSDTLIYQQTHAVSATPNAPAQYLQDYFGEWTLAHAADGSECLLSAAVEYGSDTGDPQISYVAKAWRCVFSEPTPGGTPAVSVSVWLSEANAYASAVTPGATSPRYFGVFVGGTMTSLEFGTLDSRTITTDLVKACGYVGNTPVLVLDRTDVHEVYSQPSAQFSGPPESASIVESIRLTTTTTRRWVVGAVTIASLVKTLTQEVHSAWSGDIETAGSISETYTISGSGSLGGEGSTSENRSGAQAPYSLLHPITSQTLFHCCKPGAGSGPIAVLFTQPIAGPTGIVSPATSSILRMTNNCGGITVITDALEDLGRIYAGLAGDPSELTTDVHASWNPRTSQVAHASAVIGWV